jgi:sortase (surface protein transpeptidase)
MTTGRHRLSGDPPQRRRAARAHALMLLAALTTGASAGFAWTTAQPQGASGRPVAQSGDVELVAAEPVRGLGPRPARIDIPAIEVSADLEELHRQLDGELSTPTEWDDAGWYAEGVVPGRRGPAVIVGHLDSAAEGPAVFYRLPLLRTGDEVFIDGSDGVRQRFVVDGTQKFAKSGFPTELVYGPTALAELRLVTCTGAFDAAAGSYTENLVVTAHAAG